MWRAVLSLLACVFLAFPATAAIAPTDHIGSVPILLGLDKVRRELKLDALQKAVLDSIRSEYKAAVRKLTHPMPVTPAERLAAEKKLVALNERFNQRALSVLNDSQRKRFLEIEHRFLGASMLYSPRVQRQVGITPSQQQQILRMLEAEKAYVAKINRQFEAGKISYQDRLELLRAKRIAQGRQLLRFLTPEQRDALSQLGGAPLSQ
jgi:hypothetical protein